MSIWSLRGVTSGVIRNISDAGNMETAGADADTKRERSRSFICISPCCNRLERLAFFAFLFSINLVIWRELRYNN